MVWSNSEHLTETKYFIHGSFNYDDHEDIIQPKQYMTLSRWKFLLYFCNQVSITPPTLSTLTVRKKSQKKRNK